MSENQNDPSRRQFLTTAGVSALAGIALPQVHAAENNTIQVALVGCGGRGTGAAVNALSVTNGPIKLVAMADVFPKKLNDSYDKLKSQFAGAGGRAARPPVHRLRRLQEGDGLPEAGRRRHPRHAARLPLGAVHLRHREGPERLHGEAGHGGRPHHADDARARAKLAGQEEPQGRRRPDGAPLPGPPGTATTASRTGQIGDIVAMRAYRMGQGGGTAEPKPDGVSELIYQIQRFHAFLWASGGVFSDYYIHQIDECCWMKDAWPVEAQAIGGRHYRGDSLDQNFDTYSVEYTYPDGTKLFFDGRNMAGCHDEFASYAHGTKGSAVISTLSHTPGMTRIYKGQKIPTVTSKKDLPLPEDPNLAWAFPQPENEPLPVGVGRPDRGHPPGQALQRGEARRRSEPGHLDGPHGRAHRPDHHLRPDAELPARVRARRRQADDGRPAARAAGADGKYPVPEPGIKKDREY